LDRPLCSDQRENGGEARSDSDRASEVEASSGSLSQQIYVTGVSSDTSTAARYQRNEKKDDENNEQDLGHPGGRPSYATKAQDPGNESYDQKSYSPT